MRTVSIFMGILFSFLGVGCQAQSQLHIDARSFVAPAPSSFVGGASRSPSGEVLGLNSRYLTIDGKAWLPVMGEFHYTRVPRTEWEEEILKAKASGVNILAAYVIWIHHEEIEGQFDWSGERDLRAFVELCKKHHMYVYMRIGPWAHGEVRNGGFPDWLMTKARLTRRDDPTYLRYVDLFYRQIGKQLRGQLWKDGGPVIGVQLENEYSSTGPGMGDEYILTLKKMAIEAGMDVPYYSVTGWDGAVVPKGQTIAVFGGYPDQPWDGSIKDLPPQEVYAFRFGSRVTGNMGMLGSHAIPASSENYDYPFITAEMGGGVEDTYHRRPVISPDDIAAMVPVMLGSGVNLYGYYMYQGGQNPQGYLTTLQESQRTGYPTDVPQKSYDFQAPLGMYGQERPVLRKLKIFNYFMNDFGETLAPMQCFAPAERPKSPEDLDVPRVAFRGKGDQGFLFINNYVRNTQMPTRAGFQVVISLSTGTVSIPEKPVSLSSGTYGIWPINMPFDGATLKYATAQPMIRFTRGNNTRYYFVAQKGIPIEFSWRAEQPSVKIAIHSGRSEKSGGSSVVKEVKASLDSPAFTLTTGKHVTELYVVSEEDAENLWRYESAGNTHLLVTSDEFWSSGAEIHLDRRGNPDFSFEVIPSATIQTEGQLTPRVRQQNGTSFVTASVSPTMPAVDLTQTRKEGPVPPVTIGPAPSWRSGVATIADEPTFSVDSARWKLTFTNIEWPKVKDVFLDIHYKGDVASLYSGDKLLDDAFYNGQPWEVGLRRYRDHLADGLSLSILPLRSDAPVFLEQPFRPLKSDLQILKLNSVTAIPQYELTFSIK